MYTPALVTLPPAEPSRTDQITDWFVVFATVSASAMLAPVVRVAVEGLTETVTGGGGWVTVIFDRPQRGAFAESAVGLELVDPAAEVSVTNTSMLYVPGVAGAV